MTEEIERTSAVVMSIQVLLWSCIAFSINQKTHFRKQLAVSMRRKCWSADRIKPQAGFSPSSVTSVAPFLSNYQRFFTTNTLSNSELLLVRLGNRSWHFPNMSIGEFLDFWIQDSMWRKRVQNKYRNGRPGNFKKIWMSKI